MWKKTSRNTEAWLAAYFFAFTLVGAFVKFAWDWVKDHVTWH